MAITYTWEIKSIHTDDDNNVEHIKWRKIGTDDVDNLQGKVIGETSLIGDPTAEGYVAFEDLTEETIGNWLTEATANRTARLNAFIDGQILENRLTKRDFPWG